MSQDNQEEKLKQVGDSIEKQLPGTGFILIPFDYKHPDKSAGQYVTNVQDEVVTIVLHEVLNKINSLKDR